MSAAHRAKIRVVLLGAAWLWLSAGGAATLVSAQQPDARIRVELAVDPQEVTVGDPFYAALRVIPPPGYQVEYGEFAGNDTLQALEPVSLRDGTASDSPATATYPLVAWVPGTPPRASVEVRFTASDGTVFTRSVQLQLPRVVAVLPADGEQVEPRPPKPVLDPAGGGLPWWWWLLLLLGVLAAAWLAYRYLSRSDTEEAQLSPREWALAQLDRGGAELLRAGQIQELYERTSWVLRTYLHRLRPELGLDLTTTELLGLFERGDPDVQAVGALSALLHASDRVKFARHVPPASEAAEFLAGVRSWILAYPPPLSAETSEEKQAA